MTRLLSQWTAFVVAKAGNVLAILFAATLIAGWIAISQFHMNSDTSRLIRQDTDWRANHDAFLRDFPQYDQNTFVVISGHGPDKVRQVTKSLTTLLESHSDVFSTVHSPGTHEFVETNALLFLTADELNDTISTLAEAQPFLSAIADSNNLDPALQLIENALTSDAPLPAGFIQMAEALTMAGERALARNTTPIAWRDELFQADDEQTFYQVIFVQGQQNFGVDLPNRMIIERLDQVINDFNHPFSQHVSVRLTGQVPLEHSEIQSAMDSAQLAGGLALIILIGVLVWGVRSLRIILATYLSMIVGLIWTAAFAMLTVGQYNTISIIFLVMFIGLGVDFAVHLCLKYQETRAQQVAGAPRHLALVETGTSLGPAIALCGVTSAIGFLAFVPTDYIGLAEMGIISGGGMIIAVVISLTLIPAFFAVVKDPVAPSPMLLANLLNATVARHPRTTAYLTLALAVALTLTATQARFDYSTLSLKDPASEAMTTLRELQREGIVTDYALTWVAPSVHAAEQAVAELQDLPTVDGVATPQSFLPDDMIDKVYMLEDALFLLDSVFLSPASNTAEASKNQSELRALPPLIDALEHYLAAPPESSSQALLASLESLLTTTQAIALDNPEVQIGWNALIVPPLKSEIRWLESALNAGELTLNDLPVETQSRLLTADGKALVSITPANDIVPVDAMRDFTAAVLEVLPHATGRPVLDLGIGSIVINAFNTAIGIAVACIFVILLITLRSVVDSVLVFIPLAMTAMATLAFSVLIDLPLNMANVVVIPLIFGLGVDNGIHIVKRFHQSDSVQTLVNSSTPKAVFLSNLTTLGTFCALSFSTHQGIYSIGVLLTLALSCLMLLTLIALPALLATFSTPGTDPRTDSINPVTR